MKYLFLIIFVLFTTISISYAADETEEVTLTTYYPAPYGDYDELSTSRFIFMPTALPPNDPIKGEIFFADGTDSSYEEGLYVYINDMWKKLDTVSAGDTLIGGVKMGSSQEELWSTLAGCFNPAYGYTDNYTINSWVVDSGSHSDFFLYSPDTIRITTTGDLSLGIYNISYGGGHLSYIMGKKFKVQLYIAVNGGAWYLADDYELSNPSATDGVQCNFWANSTIPLPLRRSSVYVYNNRDLYIALRIYPMPEQLNWDDELGPYYDTLVAWEAAGKPTFGATTDWNVNPNVLGTIAGPDAYNDSIPNQWYDYIRSYANLKTLNTYAGGVISDISVNVYKEE